MSWKKKNKAFFVWLIPVFLRTEASFVQMIYLIIRMELRPSHIFWLLSTVSLTFTETQLIIISRESAGCKFKKKKNGVLWLKHGLCVGGLFWSLLCPNEVCFITLILTLSSWPNSLPFIRSTSGPQNDGGCVKFGDAVQEIKRWIMHV